MKRFLKVKIKTLKKTELLMKLNKIGANIRDISYDRDGVIIEVLSSDLKKIKKYLLSYKLEILDETGVYKVLKNIRINSLTVVAIIFGLILFLILNNLTIKVNIVHQDSELREIIEEDLKKYGVVPLSFKKSYQEYEEIIAKIKEAHKDKIEWLEIDVEGMDVYVRVEERIINDYQETTGFCHIVANKSGIVTRVLTQKGVALVTINDFVNKGDILISGEVKLNEEVKNDVCAAGEVIAEVWYKVKTSYPLEYVDIKETGKTRFNLMVKSPNAEYVILKSRVDKKLVQNKLLFHVGKWEVYLQKESEIVSVNKRYGEEEALNKALEKIREKLMIDPEKFREIIKEKVLQKSVNNDNLDIDVFMVVLEDIGVKKNYTKETESDTSDSKNNGDNNTSD